MSTARILLPINISAKKSWISTHSKRQELGAATLRIGASSNKVSYCPIDLEKLAYNCGFNEWPFFSLTSGPLPGTVRKPDAQEPADQQHHNDCDHWPLNDFRLHIEDEITDFASGG